MLEYASERTGGQLLNGQLGEHRGMGQLFRGDDGKIQAKLAGTWGGGTRTQGAPCASDRKPLPKRWGEEEGRGLPLEATTQPHTPGKKNTDPRSRP